MKSTLPQRGRRRSVDSFFNTSARKRSSARLHPGCLKIVGHFGRKPPQYWWARRDSNPRPDRYERSADSGVSFLNDPNPAPFTTSRRVPQDNIDVLTENRQQPHQPIAGEIRKASIDQRRHFRLINP